MNTQNSEELAILGMQAAEDHAEEVSPGWPEIASKLFWMYGTIHPEGFMTEDVRTWAIKIGFEPPPDERAWGSVARKLAASGVIKSLDVAKQRSVNCHGSFKTVWQLVKS